MQLRALKIIIPRQIKRWLPTSLFGRSLLIIILPIALMRVAVTWVFFDAHWQTVTSRLSDGLAGDIAWAVESYSDDPRPESLARIAERAQDSMSLSIAISPIRDLPPPDTGRWVIRRKAEVVAAVRGGLLSLEQACERYSLTQEEFQAWQKSIEKHGLAGLRTTRLQQYR